VELHLGKDQWEKRTFAFSPLGSTVNVFTLTDSKKPIETLDFRYGMPNRRLTEREKLLSLKHFFSLL